MRKVVIGSLMVVVLLLGVGLYLGVERDANAAGTLSIDEMGKIKAGGYVACCKDNPCRGSGSCNGGTKENCSGTTTTGSGASNVTCTGEEGCKFCRASSHWWSQICTITWACNWSDFFQSCRASGGVQSRTNVSTCTSGSR